MQAKLRIIEAAERRWEELATSDAEYLLVAYGSVGRTCKTVAREARAEGIKVGLLRPISLWPYPQPRCRELAAGKRGILEGEQRARCWRMFGWL